jgi:hypothetical protein
MRRWKAHRCNTRCCRHVCTVGLAIPLHVRDPCRRDVTLYSRHYWINSASSDLHLAVDDFSLCASAKGIDRCLLGSAPFACIPPLIQLFWYNYMEKSSCARGRGLCACFVLVVYSNPNYNLYFVQAIGL